MEVRRGMHQQAATYCLHLILLEFLAEITVIDERILSDFSCVLSPLQNTVHSDEEIVAR
jgi:hypothetical protein